MKNYAFLLLLLFSFSPTWAQFESESEEAEEELILNPLTLQVKSTPKNIEPGQQAEIGIQLFLAPGYHAYLDKFKLQWKGSGVVHTGKLDISPIEEFEDTFSGKRKKGIKDRAYLKSIIEVSPDMSLGQQKAFFQLTYQACTKQHCLFPKKVPIEFDWVIGKGSLQKTNPETKKKSAWLSFKEAATGELKFKDVAAQGLLFSLIAIFLAGILTSLTPCVYPMIPITLAVIGAQSRNSSDSKNRFKSFFLSLVYVLGIAFTFSSLGVAAAISGSLFGSTLSHPAVTFVLAAVFVLMGLSMYGAFELQAPSFLRNSVASKKAHGYTGAFFTGLVSGIVAGPCVGPVLIGVLTHVGEKQDMAYGFLLLFTYSMGMGILFLLLGTFSGLTQKLPKAGSWMELSKFVFGSTMIAMAIYYVEPFISDQVFQVVLGLTLISIASQYGAFKTSLNTFTDRLQKGLMIAVLAIGIGYLVITLFPQSSFPAQNSSSKKSTVSWPDYSEEKFQSSLAKKPIIIDFSAEWCVACKELEALTFPHPEVLELSSKFTLLKFDATEDSPELSKMQEKYKILGLPTLVFINAQGKVLEDLTLTGFEDGPAFAERMRKAL